MDPARLFDTPRAGLALELLASALSDTAPEAARERALTTVDRVLTTGAGSMTSVHRAPVRVGRSLSPAGRSVAGRGRGLHLGRILESNTLLHLSLVVVAAAALGVVAHCVARLAVDAMLALGSVSAPARHETLFEAALRVEGGLSPTQTRGLRIPERLRVPE